VAEATDVNSNPTPKGRKTASGSTKRKGALPQTAGSGTSADPSFTESLDLAKAAVTSASAAARAKMKGATEKARTRVKETTQTTGADWKRQADEMKTQATRAARDAAGTAKAKTGTAMHSLARLISETSQTVDSRLGPQYGDYARQAANAVASAADALDQKDVDQLLGEARDFVRKSPAVAIGAAAIAGYVLMRLAKGSSNDS